MAGKYRQSLTKKSLPSENSFWKDDDVIQWGSENPIKAMLAMCPDRLSLRLFF
jgi:hypothetical protein